jgi:uncharacterized protein YhjY with autotransporter beta-barrel domain
MAPLRKITIASTLALIFSPLSAYDAFSTNDSSANVPLYDEERIFDTEGQLRFLVHFHKKSPEAFSNNEKQEIKKAFEYWVNVIKKFPQGKPANIIVARSTNGDEYDEDQDLMKVLSGTLPSKIADAIINLDNTDNRALSGVRSHLPPVHRLGDLQGMAIHELFHGFFSRDDSYNHLHDSSTPEFGGPNAHNINAVLEIHLPGADLQQIPLDMFRAHSQLDRSLLSHHNYRNYSTPLEVELALLQDLGWIIDRRNFFGYSLYRNGQKIVNENGYFNRNPEGTAYIVGTYNQAPNGVGLHIYGSRNHVTQKADILTEGPRAVGARIDGESNALVIPENTTVHASGSDGIGILFAYGKDHTFTLNGEVKADGERGVGVAFDFGGNSIGSHYEERGSYFHSKNEKHQINLLSELNGALAASVLINGTISGASKAIYMSKSGYVEKVTITPKAKVFGDIFSEYSERKSDGKPYLTSLIFGSEKSTDNTDGQKFIYAYNIQGKNLSVNFTGPYMAFYEGKHKLYDATIAPGSTLAGNSHFTLESSTGFTNSGTLSPSSAEIETFTPGADIGTMAIEGNYRQTDSGKLVINVSRKGKGDLLHVTEEAHLAGTLEVRPERTFYPNYWSERINFLQADGGIQGDFSQKIMTPSPTLMWKFIKTEHSYGVASPWVKKENPEQQDPQPPVLVVSQAEHTEVTTDQSLGVTSLSNTELGDSTRHSNTAEHGEQAQREENLNSGSHFASLAAKKSKIPGAREQKNSVTQKQPTPFISSVSALQEPVVMGEALEISRPSNAYSQYATNVNEQSVGQVLDRVVDKTDKTLKSLYEALDFSTPDGSEVRSALAQLSPVAYGAAFGVSLKREYEISDTLNARPSVPLTPGRWQAFALPFSAQASLKAQDLQVGFNTRLSGVILGLEHQSGSVPGLTWGFHGVVGNKAALSIATADSAHGSLRAWGVGLQARYQRDLLSGPYISAQVRMGLEQGSLTRTLTVSSYKGSQTGKWQGMTSTASVLGGHLWKVNDHLSVGPLVGVDYTVLTHSKIQEKGSTGVSLELEKTRYHSLQSSLGIRGVVSLSQKLAVDLQARWGGELLNTTLAQKGHFSAIWDSAFITKTCVAPQNALNVSGQATYQISPTVTLGAGASSQFAHSQKPNLTANLSLTMKF